MNFDVQEPDTPTTVSSSSPTAPRDSLGWRHKFGVLLPSTNTVVQAEFDAMRPVGVTNHTSRIRIPNLPLNSNADFERLIELLAAAQDEALDAVLSCEPDALVLGISVETFWSGLHASQRLKAQLAERSGGLPVTMGSEACRQALDLLGGRRLAILTPYQPVGDSNVQRFFEESGYQVRRIHGLRCTSPVATAQVSEATLAQALRQIDGDDVDVLLQLGTNLAMARLAGTAEALFGKPVLAVNTVLYWHALRQAGIADKVAGYGALLERH